MIDNYLIKYLCDFLIKCELCNSMEIDVEKCCICKVSYCNQCKDFLYKIHGFYENNYCKECYNYVAFT